MLLDLPGWAEASDREIARHCRVSNHLVADVRHPSGSSPTSDNPANPPSDPDLEVATVATPDPDPPPPVAERPRPVAEPHGPEPWGGPPVRDPPWPTTPRPEVPVPIRYIDIVGWLTTASDSERRKLTVDAFSFIVSADERLKVDDTVKAWLATHEYGNAEEPCDDD